MIKIGINDRYVSTVVPQSTWKIDGKLVFTGRINFYHGSYLIVANNAILRFGNSGTFVSSNFKIICFQKIFIGNSVHITWDVQIMDTSFHYIEDLNNNVIKSLTKPVIIGDYVWVGNRTTISPGSVISNFTIIASNSLVNKDYSNYGEHLMLAGIPASVIKKNVDRVWDKEKEKKLDIQTKYSRIHL